ncbi:hypothetical protein AB0A98_06425 [Streptomyces chrestomyceticus]|uniref:hypothetical protein n=1 Tax=Streptomyces chrestomyceticus TaxID=68185 RepID=UPI0033E06BB3
MNAWSGAGFEVDAEPLGCDFGEHGPGVHPTVCVQMKYTEFGGLVLWWLFWNDERRRELRIAPGCQRAVVSGACLLIKDNPGACDQSIGFTREEIAAELRRPDAATGWEIAGIKEQQLQTGGHRLPRLSDERADGAPVPAVAPALRQHRASGSPAAYADLAPPAFRGCVAMPADGFRQGVQTGFSTP